MQNVRYHSIGGVRLLDIPLNYPMVVDQLQNFGEETSENYYPTWSRAAFMDVRNVENLWMDNLQFSAEREDEREPVIVEGCKVIKNNVWIKEKD